MIEGIDLSRTVGWFTSIYPVHLNFQGTQTPIEGLKAVKSNCVESQIAELTMVFYVT